MKIQSYSDGNDRETMDSVRLHTVYSFSDKNRLIKRLENVLARAKDV